MGKSELSPEELQEFNALVDDVIRTARQPTIYGKNEERPEEFLLKLAERRIKGAVGAFLKEKEEQEEAKKEGPEAVEMLFNDYFIMAQLIVLLAILGDSLEHKARASIVKKHAVAFDPTESRFIAMVNTDIARDVKWILKECTPNKDDYPDFDFQTWAILMATRERGKTPEKGVSLTTPTTGKTACSTSYRIWSLSKLNTSCTSGDTTRIRSASRPENNLSPG